MSKNVAPGVKISRQNLQCKALRAYGQAR
jgi:hypothetical protein